MIFFVLLLVLSSGASAYESDQYTNRTQDISDSLDLLDGAVNNAIPDILARKNAPRNKSRIAMAIYFENGGLYWAAKIKRWDAKTTEVAKYDKTRSDSVQKTKPYWDHLLNFISGIA